ncbi:hypothetical protein C1N74_07615 [Microbacterium sp. SGAir0570]|nr:hypothetical protein C1N74_07615 [Microbacterium sp. SGAir0570]
MASNTINISVLADTKKFAADMDKASGVLGKLGTGLKGVGIAAGAMVGVTAVAFGAVLVDAFKAVAEVERLTAQTSAAIASTGGAAGRSVDQITGLADSLERMSGVEAEVIQSGQNMLLTFTQIKGTNFDAATKAALDMSVAMGTDMTSAATLVGKALNDPIKGVGALSKVGVQLTADQKAMVKQMTEVGDVAGAQGIILGVLNEQFGGSAEAFGGTFLGTVEKVKNSFGAITEAFVVGLLPAATGVLNFINDAFVRLADSPGFAAVIENVNAFITGLVSGEAPISGFAQTVMTLWQNFSPLGVALQVIQPLVGPLVEAFMQFATVLGGALMSVLPTVQAVISSLVGLMAALVPVIMPVITAVLGLVTPLFTLIAPLMQLVQAVLPVLIAVVTTFAQVIAAVLTPVIAALTPIIQSVVDVLSGVITFLTGVFTGNWEQAWQGIQDIFKGVWELIGNIVEGAWDIIVSLITMAVEGVLNIVKAWGPSLLNFVRDAWNNVMAFFGSIPGAVKAFFVAAGVWLVNAGMDIINGLSNGIRDTWNGVLDFFGSIPGAVMNALAGAGNWLLSAGRDIINGLVRGLSNAAGRVTDMLLDIAGNAIDAFKNFFGIASPSKLFVSYGKFMVQGLAKGLNGSNKLVDSAMGRLSSRVSNGFEASLNVSAGYRTGGSTAWSAQSAAPVVNVTFQSTLPPTPEDGRRVVEAIREHVRLGGSAAFA